MEEQCKTLCMEEHCKTLCRHLFALQKVEGNELLRCPKAIADEMNSLVFEVLIMWLFCHFYVSLFQLFSVN